MASKYRGAACWIQTKSVSYNNPLQLMISKSHTRRSFYQSKSSAVLQPIDSIAGSTWLVLPIYIWKPSIVVKMKFHYCSLFASGKVTMFLCVYSSFLLLFYQGTYKLNLKVRDHGGKELMCINAPRVKVAWLQHQTDLMHSFCESECA